jgi:hypothetical protein
VADGPTCTECQIEEGDVGDYFTVGTRAVQDEHFAGIFGETLEGWSGPSADRRLLLDPTPAPGKFDPSTFRKIKDVLKCLIAGIPLKSSGKEIDRPHHQWSNGEHGVETIMIEQPDPQNAGKRKDCHRNRICGDLVS